MGSSPEAQALLVEAEAPHPARKLYITPRLEVEALCRLAVLRYLEGCHPELARAAVAAFDLHRAGGRLTNTGDKGVWLQLKMTLERTRVVDPACGEAHMLVGALKLFEGLLAHADQILGIDIEPRARRLSIVQNNLFGVEAQAATLSRARQHLARTIGACGQDCLDTAVPNVVWGDSLVERDGFHWGEQFQTVVDAGGFQLVLGNPPYVRHERIADPLNRLPADQYKRRAFAAVEAKQHGLLGTSDRAAPFALSHRSDLCVLFTMFCLSLLNPVGVLGFVVPNALLSAQYGEPFWQTLNSAGFDRRVVENRSRRSFAEAVNTALLLVWRRGDYSGSESRPGAVGLHGPTSIISLPSGQSTRDQAGSPAGLNQLQSRIAARCMALQALGRLRYPIKTGLNRFFYPNLDTRDRFNIESRFLIPVVKSPRDVGKLAVAQSDLGSVLFHCSQTQANLRRDGASGALSYIAWGTEQTRLGCDGRTRVPWPMVPSVRGRNPWYSISVPSAAHILCPRFLHQRFFFALPESGIVEDQTFYGLTLTPELQSRRRFVGALLNSSLSYLMMETHGRTGLGDGVRQFALRDMANLPVLDPTAADASLRSALSDAFIRLSSRPILPINEDAQCPERIELDTLVCAAYGLSASDGAAARRYLVALVDQRLARAARR